MPFKATGVPPGLTLMPAADSRLAALKAEQAEELHEHEARTARLRQQVEAAAIERAAMEALAAAGCQHSALLAPHLVEQLRVSWRADGGYDVVTVDPRGEPRRTANGPLSPSDLAAELRVTPPFAALFRRR